MKAPTSPKAVDWFQLLWDMVQHGHSFSEIGRRTGIAVMTIYGYRDGSQPPHWRGELLVDLWCTVCGKHRRELPMSEIVIAPRVVREAEQVTASASALAELEQAWRGS